MKSFMPNPKHSPQNVRADKRFDALARQQTMEHAHAISNYRKEMQEMRVAMTMLTQKYDALIQNQSNIMKEQFDELCKSISKMRDKLELNEYAIKEQHEKIIYYHDQLKLLNETFAGSKELEKTKNDLESKISSCSMQGINSFQDYQREFKFLINSVKDDFSKLSREFEKEISAIKDGVTDKSYIARLDKEQVLKELKMYTKTVFVIEKKIEHLYILIERLKGESCHKPA